MTAHPSDTDDRLDEILNDLAILHYYPKDFPNKKKAEAYDKARTQINQYLYDTVLELVEEAFSDIDDVDEISPERAKLNIIEAKIRLKAKELLNG